jgi:hypothetical protein
MFWFLNCVLFIVSNLPFKKKVEGQFWFLGNLQSHRIHLQKYESMTYNIPIWETAITPFSTFIVWVIHGSAANDLRTGPPTYFWHEET